LGHDAGNQAVPHSCPIVLWIGADPRASGAARSVFVDEIDEVGDPNCPSCLEPMRAMTTCWWCPSCRVAKR
jgi:hypothetical protein